MSDATKPSGAREQPDCCGSRPHEADCPACFLQEQTFSWAYGDGTWYERNKMRLCKILRKYADHCTAPLREQLATYMKLHEDVCDECVEHIEAKKAAERELEKLRCKKEE